MIKALIALAFATCSPAEHPEPKPDGPESDLMLRPTKQHFCCSRVWYDPDDKMWNGTECLAVSAAQINQCGSLLYCKGTYGKDDGVTTCA